MLDAPPLPSPPKPRLWSALTVTVLALGAAVVIASIVLLVAMFALDAFHAGRAVDILGVTQRILDRPWGSAVLILPGQVTMFAVALVAAILSPIGLRKRLGYTRSLLPWRTFPLLLAGTLFAGMLGGWLIEHLFQDRGASLEMMQNMMQKPSGVALASLAFMICVLPPLSEEALFRGYLQRRLLQRWHPVAAIAVSSAFFVVSHFDPVHVLAVLPLGIWLGVVAWRCDSLWPSMLCHCAQNSLALVGSRFIDPADAASAQKGFDAPQIIVFVIAGALTVWAVILMRRHPVPGRVVVAPAPAPVLPDVVAEPILPERPLE
jgi:membrane protease YdiL (CAAX protease family)